MSTHETFCPAGAGRGEQLVAYLYDDMAAADRAAVESHLTTCVVCRRELNELRAVRGDLAQWMPPAVLPGVTLDPVSAVTQPHSQRWGPWGMLTEIPVWAQTAAALLCVGVAAGLANLDVRYDADGFAIRTGWLRAETADASSATTGTAVPADRPWQFDLADLEQKLRADLASNASATVAPAAVAQPSPEVTEVRGLITESEQRQQRELALRLAEVLRDVQSQRRDDLEKIDRSLGVIQANLGVVQNTGVEVMRQRQMINDLAVRVSSQR